MLKPYTPQMVHTENDVKDCLVGAAAPERNAALPITCSSPSGDSPTHSYDEDNSIVTTPLRKSSFSFVLDKCQQNELVSPRSTDLPDPSQEFHYPPDISEQSAAYVDPKVDSESDEWESPCKVRIV